MKYIFSICLALSASSAFAGYNCQSDDGKSTLVIGGSWLTGSSADFNSADVRDFYKSTEKIDVGVLKTIMDPESQKYVSQVKKNANDETVYSFMQGSTATDTAWNMEINASKGTGSLTDQNGKQFKIQLTCVSTPDLE